MLEQLFPASWLERRTWFSFIVGFSYAVLGIASAVILFKGDPALAAVAFTSLLILPSFNRMLAIETKQAGAEKKFTITDSFKNHKDIFEVFLFLFFGINPKIIVF